MSRKIPRKLDPLQKRVPANPKYKNVKPTIDTGASLSKQLQKIEELKQNYRFSKDEIFKRMKLTTFVQLLVQVYHLENDDLEIPESPSGDGPRTVRRNSADPDVEEPPEKSVETDRSTLLGVTHGVGEMDMRDKLNRQTSEADDATDDGRNRSKRLIVTGGGSYSSSGNLCPYLLLDVRDRDAYDRCRIIPALSYPKAMLSRSVNYESKEMLAFKNKEGKVIVVYDDDETIAPVVATSLVQRGYDNIFMLSGGLRVACKMFPEGLITGTVPPSLLSTRGDSGPQGKKGNHPQMEQTMKKALEAEDVERLEVNLSNLMRTSLMRGTCSSIIGSRSSRSAVSLKDSRAPSSRNGSISLASSRPAFKP